MRLYNYGEPLLHRRFGDIVAWIRSTAPELHIEIATNGVFLDDDRIAAIVGNSVDDVYVSVHGGPGTENMLRYSNQNADYGRVIGNVARLVEQKNRSGNGLPRIILKAILFNWNDTDELMQRLKADGERIGVDKVWWALDWGTGLTDRASKRFKRGSRAFQELNDWGTVKAR